MMLIDAGKLDYIEVDLDGYFRVSEIDSPIEYKVVSSPIKVKFAKDILALMYASRDEDGHPRIAYNVLNSTKRKFKDDYVNELINRKCDYNRRFGILRFHNC